MNFFISLLREILLRKAHSSSYDPDVEKTKTLFHISFYNEANISVICQFFQGISLQEKVYNFQNYLALAENQKHTKSGESPIRSELR